MKFQRFQQVLAILPAMIVVSYCEEGTCGSPDNPKKMSTTVQGHLTDILRSLFKVEILPEIDAKISNIEQEFVQLKEKDQKIDDLQGRFEDQLSQKDQKITDLQERFDDQLSQKDQKIADLQERFDDQLLQKDQKIDDLQGRFDDQLSQKDRVINSLTNTVNEMKAQIQVRSKISKSM